MRTKPTQAMIARELNLSRNTVSKVLNNIPGITEATRKRVLDKAAELNYRHNTAVVPHSPQPPALGCLNYDIVFLCHAHSFAGSFWPEIIKSMERYLEQYFCTIRFVVVLPEHERGLSFPLTLTHNQPDGIVVAGLFDQNYYRHVAGLNLPLVSYDTAPSLFHNNMICDVVMVENTSATYRLTRHMLEKGHRRIAFAGDRDSCQSFFERWQGYQQAMQEAAGDGAEELLLDFSGTAEYYTVSDFYRQLSGVSDLPTAFVCGNDSIARSAYTLCTPPFQLYSTLDVCGFDNTKAFISSIPHCSTVEFPLDEVGQALAESILWRIKNPNHAFRSIRIASSPILK